MLAELRGRVADVIAGRPCTVVGSAPTLKVVPDGRCLIAVNGGISSIEGRAVPLWLLNARVQMGNARLHRLMWQQGKGYDVTLAVLLVREPEASALMLRQLAAQGTVVGNHIDIEHIDRMAMESESGGRLPEPLMSKHALSAGLTAVCLALWAGAPSVRLSGISWTVGYAYTDVPAGTNRGHARSDQLALSLLVRRYGDRVQHALDLPASLSEESLVPSRNRPRTRGIAPSPVPAPVSNIPAGLRVRATQIVFYNLQRYRVGDVFTLRATGDFKKSCMAHVGDDTPLQSTSPVQAQRQAHHAIVAGRAPKLQPNAADEIEAPPAVDANVSPIEA